LFSLIWERVPEPGELALAQTQGERVAP